MSDKNPHSFLTDTHRAVLSGDWEGSDSTLRSHKSEIRKRSKAALQDLITVANSTEIDNESRSDGERLFEPEDLRALLTSVAHHGGLRSEEYEHVSEAYQNEVYKEANRFLLGFQPDDLKPAEAPQNDTQDSNGDTPVTCHNCGYKWEYGGSASKATCPGCSNKTPVSR